MLIYLVIDLAAGAMGILDQQVDKKSTGRDLPISSLKRNGDTDEPEHRW